MLQINVYLFSKSKVQRPIAFGVSFLQSQISIHDLVLQISFATFRWKETNKIEIGDWDYMTHQTQWAPEPPIPRCVVRGTKSRSAERPGNHISWAGGGPYFLGGDGIWRALKYVKIRKQMISKGMLFSSSQNFTVNPISFAKISTGYEEACQSLKQCRQLMAKRRHYQAHRQRLQNPSLRLGVSNLCQVYITGLAASLPTLPSGLAYHGRCSKRVEENEMSLFAGEILFVEVILKSASSSEISVCKKIYRFFCGRNTIFPRIWHCTAVLFLKVPKKRTDLDLSLLYILTLGTYSKFARKNNFLALSVCFPQPCSSAGRRFAASRSCFQNYRRIVSFAQQKNRWNAL